MQQGTSRTPCRRLGLRRVSSFSRSASPSTTASPKSISEGSNSTSFNSNQKSCALTTGPHLSKRLLIDLSESPKISTKDGQDLPQTQESIINQVEGRTLKPKDIFVTPDPQTKLPAPKRHCVSGPDLRPSTGSSENLLVIPARMSDLNSLRKRVALKEKQLQQLCQTKIYHKKHDPDQLMLLVQQWLQGCQEALQELLSELNSSGNLIGMSELLEQLAIPPSLVNFNVDTNEFFD